MEVWIIIHNARYHYILLSG